MNKNDLTLFGCFGALISVVVLLVVNSLMNGWALVKLWGWFIVPTFEQAPSLTIVQAIGVGMVVSYLTFQVQDTSRAKEKSVTENIVNGFLWAIGHPLLVVLIGWIVQSFM